MLEKINKPNDIHKIALADFPELAAEIRQFLIRSVSHTGGHLASNLGVVELTLALHNVLDLPQDKIIWDVGHQAYTHKILTGRKDGFANLRKEGGMSGFPKRKESDCDSFDAGHSSNSISAGLGYVRARDLQGQNYRVVSVIGDGSLTGGMAYEAMNNAAELKTNFIIVLNDNNMSISKNVGGISSYLSALRTAEAYTGMKMNTTKALKKIPKVGPAIVDTMRKTKSSIKQLIIPGMFFENMGITYLGPVDGHNLMDLVRILREAKKVNGAVVVHVQTEKGRGYQPAEEHPDRFHGTGPFDIPSGQPLVKKEKPNYTDVFSTVITKIAAKDDRVVAITAAMADGTGLKRFRAEYPARFFDVGIAEGHAVTFAAGLAAAGMHPVFAVYSSFLQRGFDQIVHDICMQNLPVVFAVDRAGLVGADGETHQGVFDLSYLGMIPNMMVLAPKNKWELADMLRFAFRQEGPVALRYPRGTAYDGLKEHRAPIVYGQSEWIFEERQIAIFAVGNMMEEALKVHELLHERGYDCSLINARFVKPLDYDALRKAASGHLLVVTMEENILWGGFGYAAAAFLSEVDETVKVLHFGIDDQFVQHGTVSQLHVRIGLDAASMTDKIIETYQKL